MILTNNLHNRIRQSLSALISFKAPVIKTYACVRIFVAQRPCLLVSWNAKYTSWIRIKPLRRRYSMCSGSVIFTIPAHLKSVTIIAANVWGRSRQMIELRDLSFDEFTNAAMNLKPDLIELNAPRLKTFGMRRQSSTIKINKPLLKNKNAFITRSAIHFQNPSS